MADLTDALDGLSRRKLEELAKAIDRRLVACTIDPQHDGAIAVRATYTLPGKSSAAIALMLCPACIERHRLRESRAGEAADA